MTCRVMIPTSRLPRSTSDMCPLFISSLSRIDGTKADAEHGGDIPEVAPLDLHAEDAVTVYDSAWTSKLL